MKLFDPQKVRAAAREAVNDVADTGKAEASRVIREGYNIKARSLSRFLKITARAKGDSIVAVITGVGMGLAAAYFDPKQEGMQTKLVNLSGQRFKMLLRKSGRNRGGLVTTVVRMDRGRKVLRDTPKPFMVQPASGHIGVFKRVPGKFMKAKGKEKKEAIETVFGPGVGGLFRSPKVMNRVIKIINRKFAGRFDFWLKRKLGQQ